MYFIASFSFTAKRIKSFTTIYSLYSCCNMSCCPIMRHGSFQQKNIGILSVCTIHTPNKHIIILHVCLFGHSDLWLYYYY